MLEAIFFMDKWHKKRFLELLEKYHQNDSYRFVAALYICAVVGTGFITEDGIDKKYVEKSYLPPQHIFLLKVARSLLGSEQIKLEDIAILGVADTLILTEAIKIGSLGLAFGKSIEIRERIESL